jgi:hypothetical protein
MQGNDARDLGELVTRAIGTALIPAGEVPAVVGAFRRGTKDYYRYMAGTGAARRCYFGDSYMDMDSEFAGGGIGRAVERELPGAVNRCRQWDAEESLRSDLNGAAEEDDFEMVLDSFMLGK